MGRWVRVRYALTADKNIKDGASGARQEVKVFGHKDAEETSKAKHARKGFGSAQVVGASCLACGLENFREGCLDECGEECAHVGVEGHRRGPMQA